MRSCDEFLEQISAEIDGELPESEASELHAHMASCDECRLAYEALTGISEALMAELGDLSDPPPELLSGAMSKIKSLNPAPKKRNRHIIRLVAAAACFALIIIGITQIIPGESPLPAVYDAAEQEAAQQSEGASDTPQDAVLSDIAPFMKPEAPRFGGDEVDGDAAESAPVTTVAPSAPAPTPSATLPPVTDADDNALTADAPTVEPDANAIATVEPSPAVTEPLAEPTAGGEESADDTALQSEDTPDTNVSGELLGQIVSAKIFNTATNDFILDTSETETLVSLVALMVSRESVDFEPAGPATYVVTFIGENGGSQSIEVWVEEIGLVCSAGTDHYLAAGSESELIAFFAGL